jgi:hypothetical protein
MAPVPVTARLEPWLLATNALHCTVCDTYWQAPMYLRATSDGDLVCRWCARRRDDLLYACRKCWTAQPRAEFEPDPGLRNPPKLHQYCRTCRNSAPRGGRRSPAPAATSRSRRLAAPTPATAWAAAGWPRTAPKAAPA